MSKVLIGVFTVVFVGALASEMVNRTKPHLTEKFEARCSEGLNSFLRSSGATA